MLRSLQFDCDFLDQPAAIDRLERRTWCALRIRVGQLYVSRIRDDSIDSDRINLYVPAFPIVEWLMANWWALLNELCPWETIPGSVIDSTHQQWIARHCLRAADSSLALPSLFVFFDGRDLCAQWQADPDVTGSNKGCAFIEGGAGVLDRDATQDSLAEFIDKVLARTDGLNDDRVDVVVQRWTAIRSTDDEERGFCEIAGRLGLDPYDESQLTVELAEFLEKEFPRPENPLVRDLTEIARADSIVAQWSWLTQTQESLKLHELTPRSIDPFCRIDEIEARGLSAPRFGYRLAERVRKASNLAADAKLESVEETVRKVVDGSLRGEAHNHVPGKGIRALIAEDGPGQFVAAGPLPQRPDNRRFILARCLNYLLTSIGNGSRLVTEAHSWDQKASRAFAAELLAPQKALRWFADSSPIDRLAIDELAKRFEVSTRVIDHQLENAGIPVVLE